MAGGNAVAGSSIPAFVRRPEDEPPAQDKLDKVRAEAARLRDLYLTKAGLVDRVAEVDASINLIESKTLLDLMVDAKMPDFSLEAEGNDPPAAFRRTTIVNASIPAEMESQAWVWLEEEGADDHGADLIKNKFTIEFNMGEHKQAKRLEALLTKGKFEYRNKVSVLSVSLTAWVKRRLAAHKVVANDLLGVFIGEKVEVTLAGEKVKKQQKRKQQ